MNFLMYFRRVVGWRLNQVEPTEAEGELLDKVSNTSIQKYLVWRKTVLAVSIAPVFFAAVMGFIGVVGSLGDPFSAFGSFILLLPRLDGLVLFFGVCLSRWWWNLPLRTTLRLKIFWVASFVMPLVPGLFPIELLVKSETRLAIDHPDSQATVLTIKVSLAIHYALTIVPIIVTFPSSLGRAGLRMVGLYPTASSLPGFLLLVAVPFYSLFVFMALVVITQLVGSVLLLIATILMICGPWIMVARGNLYVKDSSTPKQDKQLNWTQTAVCIVNVSGVFLLAIWALTAQAGGIRVTGRSSDENALLTYGELVRLVFEMIGRLLVTTVVFADVLIQMIAKNWSLEQDRLSKGQQDDSIDETYFTLFGIRGCKPESGKEIKESSTPSNASEEEDDDCEKPSDYEVAVNYDVEALSVSTLGAYTYNEGFRAPQPHCNDDDGY